MERTYNLVLRVKVDSEAELKNRDVRNKLSEKITFPSQIEIEGQQLQVTFVDVEE